MSDEEYGEEFENYDDEDFEPAEDDYDVLPTSITKTSAPSIPSQAPQSPTPNRPRSVQQYGRPTSSAGLAGRPLDIPQMPALTDVQQASARKKLTAALVKIKMLSLEEITIDELFINAEQTQYDLFSMGRGPYAGKKAGAVQTNDDAKEEECQTDEIEFSSFASQAPDDRNSMTESEVDQSSVTVSAKGSAAAAAAAALPAPGRSAASMRITNMEAGMELKLASFMRWAGPLVLAALGIAPNSKKISLKPDPNGGKGFAAGISSLLNPDLLSNRPVTALAFAAATGGEPLVLVAYGPVGAQLGGAELLKDHTLATKGCLCVWDLSAPAAPKAVLISEGSPTCCGFAPSPASSVVFAGMEEGGVCLWDLEESESLHPTESVGGRSICTRRPAYTTECSPDLDQSAAPVTSLVAVPRGSRSTPCYLYSLSAWGGVNVWTMNMLSRTEAASVDLDLGMRLGSCVRLIKVSSNVRLGMAALGPGNIDTGTMSVMVQCSSLQPLAHNPRHFLVGADGGRVLKGSWVGVAPPPKEYLPHDHNAAAILKGTGRSRVPSCVTALHVSPVCPWAFLSGHDDGTVALHSLAFSTAAIVWPAVAAGGVKALRWSPARPSVFFVLDAMCMLSCFDLSKNRSSPVYSQSFMVSSPGGASLATCFEVGALPQDTASGEQLPGFVVGYDDGRVDFLSFSEQYIVQQASEAGVLVDMVGAAPK
ncbi:hypothetical protein CEUSTIGMA_g2982.t1 [Chlamydomonas eustigma]|uniref:WD repeat-containing protein 60 n=1 Tax=Chlamydomonas eustigma TaxID=1157962 RepID=A0A250WXX2_9CHLO|nr:hypothetical protein CEUSTIGMA_g2982.t1 [Chlamydomonas eustigma]|eukprot:GAX75539.1 hypothetical protein CEUSTIGMA_g2982.t1 [Chlamydomonas eustigma]